MMPGSINLPVRKREEKGKRKEGKSHRCRRGGPKSKAMPAVVVAIPSKTPSPGTNPSTPPAPAVVQPPTNSVPLPLSSNNLKDPTANSPNVPNKETKVYQRKIKEKGEKDPPRTTIRKKKNSATQSISIDVKTSSENDSRVGKKKKSNTSSDSGRKRVSVENKSDGSKEPSENDEKTPQITKDMQKNFFKQMAESQRARKRSDDARLERMPESSQINASIKSLRKKGKPPSDPNPVQIKTLFNEHGVPVWVVPEKSDNEYEKENDGSQIKNRELAQAMFETSTVLDDKSWLDYVTDYIACSMPRGSPIPENYHLDSLAPLASIKANDRFATDHTLAFNTVKNLVDFSEIAMKRWEQKRDGTDIVTRPNHKQNATIESTNSSIPPKNGSSAEMFQLKTCVASNVSFNMKSNVTFHYDRHHPITSIKKLRKRMNNTYSMEQTTQIDSKEKS